MTGRQVSCIAHAELAAHNAAKKGKEKRIQSHLGWDEAFCAHHDNISNEDRTHVYTADEHERLETSCELQLSSQGPNSPMKQREDYTDAVKIKDRLHRESGGANQKYIPANKYGKERINRSQDPVKEPNELTRKPDGNGILLPPQVLIFVMVAINRSTVAGMELG